VYIHTYLIEEPFFTLLCAEERIDVSRRQALLAALAFTVPASPFFQRDAQALAVEYVSSTPV
jgi:hypothetical protein